MKAFLDGAVTAARSAGSLATDATRRIADAGIGAKGTVLDAAVAARNGVIGTKDAVVGYATAATDVTVIVASGLAFKGFVVAAIVAPIPTLIGTILLDAMLGDVSDRIEGARNEIEARRRDRDNARILDRLARYGRIPATALVETESACLRLDTVAGTVSGRVKAGAFEDRPIEGMTNDELRSFASSVDRETAGIVDSYLRYRARSAMVRPDRAG